MIVVVHGFEVHDQRRVAVETQGGGGKERSLQAVPLALSQDALRRPRRISVLVLQRVNELLDSHRSLERAQFAHILRQQAEALAPVSPHSVFRKFLSLQWQDHIPFGKTPKLYRFAR